MLFVVCAVCCAGSKDTFPINSNNLLSSFIALVESNLGCIKLPLLNIIFNSSLMT